jgi:small-conductance mechanosensitive channel
VQVQVAYDSDVEAALALLTEVALREPRVLRGQRAPAAYLVNFSDSGILLELGMWIDDPHNGQLNLKSSVNRAIFAEFKARGIRIPSPQREIRIVGGASAPGDASGSIGAPAPGDPPLSGDPPAPGSAG